MKEVLETGVKVYYTDGFIEHLDTDYFGTSPDYPGFILFFVDEYDEPKVMINTDSIRKIIPTMINNETIH